MIQNLSEIAKTLLMPLYIRAEESQRADALIHDEAAVALVHKLGASPDWFQRMKVDEEDRVAVVLRNREIDHWTREFLVRQPHAVVVHLGCGLDTRFRRVDDGQVEWYDLDLPQVIELRRQLLGDAGLRYHHLACSVLDSAWMDQVSGAGQRPLLFVAEGVLMYLEAARVKALVRELRGRFPGAELITDSFTPFMVRANNLRYARTGIGARCLWGLKRGRDVEQWADGICLLKEWYPFSRPEPRLARAQWVTHIPFLARVMGVFHYRLGLGAPRPAPASDRENPAGRAR